MEITLTISDVCNNFILNIIYITVDMGIMMKIFITNRDYLQSNNSNSMQDNNDGENLYYHGYFRSYSLYICVHANFHIYIRPYV